MAKLGENLWEYNVARIIVVDVSHDYRLMQPPMPSDFYPILAEVWMPRHNLAKSLPRVSLLSGYLYDWHEPASDEFGHWYVGVVKASLTYEDVPAVHAVPA